VAFRKTPTVTNDNAEKSAKRGVWSLLDCDQTNPEVFSIELFHERSCDKERAFISRESRLYRGVLVYGKPERIRGVFRLLDLHCPFEYTEPASFKIKQPVLPLRGLTTCYEKPPRCRVCEMIKPN
jgi:hypothetical protein